MERGGAYFFIIFLTGCITGGILEYNQIFPVPYFLFILFSALCLLCLIRTHFRRTPPQSFHSKYRPVVIACLACFLLGMVNMQRYRENETEKPPGFFQTKALVIRETLARQIKQRINGAEEQAVAIAFILGDKSDIPYRLKQAYKNSGTMHILALSGLHTGIIYGVISTFLFFLNIHYKTKKAKLLLSAIIIFVYAFITGFSPSVQRAGIMILSHRFLSLSGRQNKSQDTLFLAAFLILLIHPYELFNIGFQLSFAAVTGIIVLYPVLNESLACLVKKKQIRHFLQPVWSLLTLSIACQITTAPFAWYYFHSAPQYFLLANLAAIPLVTIALYLFPVVIILAPVPVAGTFSAVLLQIVIKILNQIVLLLQ